VPIVNSDELNKYMSAPEWSPEQKDAAKMTLAGVESTLEDQLYDAPISPRPPFQELAPITPRGVVMTRYPVFQVVEIDGVTVDDDHPLAPPWSKPRGYVHRFDPAAVSSGQWPSFAGGYSINERNLDAVVLTYLPGWGPIEALRIAILEKASLTMENMHDDTMTARGTDGQKLPARTPLRFSDLEIRALSSFRNNYLAM
jgi:hypothetical protein